MSSCVEWDGVDHDSLPIEEKDGRKYVTLGEGMDLIFGFKHLGSTFHVTYSGRFQLHNVVPANIGLKLSKVLKEWSTAVILPCSAPNEKLTEIKDLVKGNAQYKPPTDEEQQQAELRDETRQDIDGVVMSWEETKRRYEHLPDCDLAVLWAYWTCMPINEGPKGAEEEDWALIHSGRISDLAKPEDSDSDSLKLMRAVRRVGSSSGSHASDRATSEPPVQASAADITQPAREKP